MPFFEYVCSTCGNAFEKPDQKGAGAAECPACGSPDLGSSKAASTPASSSEPCTPKG